MQSLQLDFSHLPREGKLLVACSGGADSLALLLALYRTEYSYVVAHVNHGTRRAHSDEDEVFVREICAPLNIAFASTRLTFPTQKPSEAEMRHARYAALQNLAREYSCSRIATGHTASDVLETILINWLRGASVAGFAGIAPQRELESGVLLVRPMLGVTREAARDFLTSHGWQWREDASNESGEFLRNRVRHELLPVLFQLCGQESTQRLAKQSARAAQVYRNDLEFLDYAANAALENLTLKVDADLLVLDGAHLGDLPVALQRRVLRLAASHISVEARDLEMGKIEGARGHILENGRRAVWQWRKDLRVEWTGEYSGQRIRFSRV
jgi:tRNA(Ile)-lysidine synthase